MATYESSFSSSCDPFRVCFKQTDCWDSDDTNSSTARGWVLVFVLIGFGITFILLAELAPRYEVVSRPILRIHQLLLNPLTKRAKARQSLEAELESCFLKTKRSELNFCLNTSDLEVELPEPNGAEYEPEFLHGVFYPLTGFLATFDPRGGHGSGIFSLTMMAIVVGSLGLALVGSAISTVLYLVVRYEEQCSGFYKEDAIILWIQDVGKGFSTILSEYNFFPIFLLVGYIGFITQRWREWMVNCHTIQAKIQDIAMFCGGSTGSTVNMTQRKQLYKIYRLLNFIHVICYLHASPTLGKMDLRTDFVNKLNLLTIDEAYDLINQDNRPRQFALTQLVKEVQVFLAMEGVRGEHSGLQIHTAIAELRGTTARHHGKTYVHFVGRYDFYSASSAHSFGLLYYCQPSVSHSFLDRLLVRLASDLFVRDNPNMYMYEMVVVVNLMLFLVLLGYPFSLMTAVPAFFPWIPGFQPLAGLGIYIQALTIRSAYGLLLRLKNPYAWTVDRIKVDNLVGSTDRSIFVHFASKFWSVWRRRRRERG